VLVEEEDGSFDEVLDVLEKTGRNIETFESTQIGAVCREVGLNKRQRGSRETEERSEQTRGSSGYHKPEQRSCWT